jgi:AcrR family transcriptional regulator
MPQAANKAVNRRMGPHNAATRILLMDATETVMREEGYAAVTSRRVAERAGVNQQTVYYYFQTMDDLLVAAFRRRTQTVLDKVEQALNSPRPLHAFWQASSESSSAGLTMEYLALANHNQAIRLETIEFGERLRRIEVDRLGGHITTLPPNSAALTPFAVVMAITYVGHVLGLESAVGLRGGHRETRMLVEWCLRQLEPAGSPAKSDATPIPQLTHAQSDPF